MSTEGFTHHLVLRDRVQRNCHISDARHARDYTLCIYLLKMRELFRWEQRLAYTAVLPKSELGEWIVAREKLWESLEEAPFEPLLINNQALDPFDNEAINQQLRGMGLVYSGGVGGFAKPHFFIGELEEEELRDGVHLFVAGEEYARDITAPPAAALGDTIIIRRHSLRRMLWEKIEEWRWNTRGEAMSRAMACYPFDHDSEAALDAMTRYETEAVILHELGEVRAGRLLGSDWERLLADTLGSREELVVRAMRDHLVDSLFTLPALVQADMAPSLHFYFANLGGMRREIAPTLMRSYVTWLGGGNHRALLATIKAAADHWSVLCEALLKNYSDRPQRNGKVLVAELEGRIAF